LNTPKSSLKTNEVTNEQFMQGSPNHTMNFLADKYRWLERDLLNLGTVIFNTEKYVKLGKNVKAVSIPLSPETMNSVALDQLKYELEDLILNVLVENVEVKFTTDNRAYRWKQNRYDPPVRDAVCLFSGGVDSYSGILNASKHYSTIAGVSVIHGDQSWGSNIIDNLTKKIQSHYNIPFYKLYAPKMMSRGYSQLRGFLYALYGGIYLNMTKASTLLITEVGPTMYQPRFSPHDSITMTTHPFVLNKVKRIFDLLFRREVKIVIPYENMTKAEVVAASPFPEGFPHTHSCISLRFGKSDGTCFGCTVRRLGFLVAGREDTIYTHDPIGNKTGNVDNLITLMRFSYDFLTDYKHMLASSVENIENYKKKDLFKRHAIDTFSGLYVYKNEIGDLNPNLDTIYNAAIKKLTVEKIEKRIKKVRNTTFKPNFNKII